MVDEAPFLSPTLEAEDVNLDDEQEPLVALPFPASTALMGLAFVVCALLISGLPPLSTFIGKIAMASAAFAARDAARCPFAPGCSWASARLGAALACALMRTGIRTFWSAGRRAPPRVSAPEGFRWRCCSWHAEC